MKKIQVGNVVFGQEGVLVLIAGPCVIETEESALYHAREIKRITQDLKIPFVYKASYDKANRSSIRSFRGPGFKKGLSILKKIKEKLGMPILSDVHCQEEVAEASAVLDIIQIPAFLCRQTDLILEAAKTRKIVNVKKGQFLAPWDVKNILEKIESVGNRKILITERGTSFGYNTLVSDFRSIPIMRRFGYPVIFDASHSVQQPGGLGNISGGQAEFIPTLARCAVAAGCDGIFLEVHRNPPTARSDALNSLNLKELRNLLQILKKLKQVL